MGISRDLEKEGGQEKNHLHFHMYRRVLLQPTATIFMFIYHCSCLSAIESSGSTLRSTRILQCVFGVTTHLAVHMFIRTTVWEGLNSADARSLAPWSNRSSDIRHQLHHMWYKQTHANATHTVINTSVCLHCLPFRQDTSCAPNSLI